MENAVECKQIVFNKTFWRNCLVTMKVMTHLLRLLWLYDLDENIAFGYVYAGMRRAWKSSKNCLRKKELYKPYTNIIDWTHDNITIMFGSATNHENFCSKRKMFDVVLDMVENNISSGDVLGLTISLGEFTMNSECIFSILELCILIISYITISIKYSLRSYCVLRNLS
uniref:Uncharacterized protein n=1 Tax=Lactuca sativa TaxID=4236 RepID=A0A9R1XYA1_LACSA|nr:hypothetical protein LSAT_V11C100006920 [Lactuca sativa]